jgi:uncharacterized membrane protein YeaQ/YmgE (transglycosylase-associated protein family)
MQTSTKAPVGVPDSAVWAPWPINWSAVWVGALTGLAAAVIFGLIGAALGNTATRSLSWTAVTRLDVALAVLGAFFSFAAAGWAAAKVAGIPYAEPAMLHGAIAWLVAMPLVLALLSFGAGSAFGGWYDGLAGPASIAPAADAIAGSARATALTSLTAILLGLMGSVIGGWIASGEPMTLSHYRTRKTVWSKPERSLL